MFKSFLFYGILAVQVSALPRNYHWLFAEEKQDRSYEESVATGDLQERGAGKLLDYLGSFFGEEQEPTQDSENLVPDYGRLTAEEKQRLLYGIATRSEQDCGVNESDDQATHDFDAVFERDLKPIFERESDERPKEWYKDKMGKPFHRKGYVATAKFDAIDNPFTGGFKGTKYLLMRVSDAHPKFIIPDDPKFTIPGVAIKFLRSKMRSVNVHAMFSLYGQNSSNFFENNFANHVKPKPGDLDNKFKKVTNLTSFLGTSDLASFDDDGNEIQEPVFPFLVQLRPNRELNMTVQESPSIEPNTLLYEVWAQSAPEDKDLIRLGDIITTSKFVGSTWGDRFLFFQHQDMQKDVDLKPEWKPYVTDEALKTCPCLAH